ncbi:uncharacterized protein LOC119283671 [Triticum dicoccoides]|uniref:uncharacterized protein LOC119283671 n=1 Tax=Triticum dicoccoides TaxID=85692 RepID=UPI00189051C9|nr:uncharacterized protein LOC119283671 [Triticum dicoccoides]
MPPRRWGSSGYRGIREHPNGWYSAEIRSGDVRLGLGSFRSAYEAARAQKSPSESSLIHTALLVLVINPRPHQRCSLLFSAPAPVPSVPHPPSLFPPPVLRTDRGARSREPGNGGRRLSVSIRRLLDPTAWPAGALQGPPDPASVRTAMDGPPGALLPSPDLAARPVAGPCSGSGQQHRLRLDSDAHNLPPPPAPCMPPARKEARHLVQLMHRRRVSAWG